MLAGQQLWNLSTPSKAGSKIIGERKLVRYSEAKLKPRGGTCYGVSIPKNACADIWL